MRIIGKLKRFYMASLSVLSRRLETPGVLFWLACQLNLKARWQVFTHISDPVVPIRGYSFLRLDTSLLKGPERKFKGFGKLQGARNFQVISADPLLSKTHI